jgi:CRISPR/Cas system CSM-associated protein Csm4 (group 5 of RAMP superfamily)
MTQVVEHPPHKTLNSNTSTANKRKKKKKYQLLTDTQFWKLIQYFSMEIGNESNHISHIMKKQ